MFGRDPILPLNTLLGPKLQYLGNDINILLLEAMKNMFEIATTNLKLAWEKRDPEDDPKPVQLQPGDTGLVQNHTKGPFDPKYIGDYCVVSIKGNQVEVRPSIGGPTEMNHMKHVNYVHPADQYLKHVPDYSTFGRKATLRMNPKDIPDLNWQLADKYHTTNIGQTTLQISTTSVDVNTISFAGGGKYNACGINLHINTTTINSNIDTILCTGRDKIQ